MNIQPITLTATTLTATELPFTVIGGVLASDASIIGTPLQESAATGDESLNVPQRSAVIGEPIPIVFCRRINGTGGVLISPPATEARFEDNSLSNPIATGDLTASYHLVLSEGQIDSIQIRDVFQRACRIGTFTQTYDRRAGTFIPGNFVTNTPDFEAPTYCGAGGTYAGLSTMAFSATTPIEANQWNLQVHCFVRGGIYVPRLLDNVTGPSNNVADLFLYLLRNSSRVPEQQINSSSLLTAATFTNANGFWFNGVISESTNLRDWMNSTFPYFLLRQYRNEGKEGLRPLLQTNANGTIKTTAVNWVFTFTEEHVIPGSFQIAYTPLADRKPVCINVLWRQQDDLGISVIRTAAVRYTGTAEDGPFEQHDLSSFCASENHAVKVGTYILSKRNHILHRLQIGVKPDAFNGTLQVGDLVRVLLERIASTGSNSRHDYLYEVDRIGKSSTGEVQLELTHFPIDENLASVVAKEVNAAVGAGVLLPTGLTGVTCDVNSSGDTGIPADTGLGNDYWQDYWADEGFPNILDSGSFETQVEEEEAIDTTSEITEDDPLANSGWFGDGGGSSSNPSDSLGGQNSPESGAGGITQDGNELSYTPGCEGAYTEWRLVDDATGEITVLGTGSTFTVVEAMQTPGVSVIGVGRCPDGSSPDGYGPEIPSAPFKITNIGFLGFTILDPGYWLYATLYDLDSCTSITGTVVLKCNTGSNSVGTVQSSTGTYASSYPPGAQVNIGTFTGGMPVVVNDVIRHINPDYACGNPTGYLVRVQLSNSV